MNMKIITLFFSCVLLVSIAYSNESQKQLVPSIEEKNPNHFYFGPEFLCYQLNIHVRDVKVHGDRFFWGLRIGYEYLKPKAFYAGADILGTSTENDFKASINGQPVAWQKVDRIFGNLEIRLGYTFAPTNWMTTPFLGVGIYDVFARDHHNHQGFKEDLPYAAIGVRSKHAFTTLFNLGVNLKILRTFDAEQHFKFEETATEHHNMWGGEIGFPFTWHIGSTKRWDILLEPYFLKLDFFEVQNIYGTRVLFGYRF